MGFGFATPGVRAQTCAGGAIFGLRALPQPVPGGTVRWSFPEVGQAPLPQSVCEAASRGVRARSCRIPARARAWHGRQAVRRGHLHTHPACVAMSAPSKVLRSGNPRMAAGPRPRARPCGRRARRGRGRRAGTRRRCAVGSRAGPVPAQGAHGSFPQGRRRASALFSGPAGRGGGRRWMPGDVLLARLRESGFRRRVASGSDGTAVPCPGSWRPGPGFSLVRSGNPGLAGIHC
jgi:hypothetical protein